MGWVVSLNEIGGEIVDAAMKVHTALGPALLESAYEACLTLELRKRGLGVARQVSVPLVYDGVRIRTGCRLDLLVEDQVIVEIKAVTAMQPLFEAKLLSALSLSGRELALLINFRVVHLKDGIKRLINSRGKRPSLP